MQVEIRMHLGSVCRSSDLVSNMIRRLRSLSQSAVSLEGFCRSNFSAECTQQARLKLELDR